MVSSKGEPDDPKLRQKCKDEVLNMEKGGGKGSWSAWKAGELARIYESRGGGYKDTGDNKNKAQKGYPERKDGKDNTGIASRKKEDKKEEKKDDKADDKREVKKDDKKEKESKDVEKKNEDKADGGEKESAPKKGGKKSDSKSGGGEKEKEKKSGKK